MPGPVVTSAWRRRPARRSRRLEERLSVRFPSAFRRVAARIARLSPESRLKRALYVRSVHSGWDAFNRRDFDSMLVRYAPDLEFQFTPGQQTLGLDGTYHGHEGLLAGLGELAQVWDSTTLVPAYVVDLETTGAVPRLHAVLARARPGSSWSRSSHS